MEKANPPAFVCGRFGWSCNNLGLWKVRIAVNKASKRQRHQTNSRLQSDYTSAGLIAWVCVPG